MRSLIFVLSLLFFINSMSSQSFKVSKQVLYFTTYQGLDITLAPEFDAVISGNMSNSVQCGITLTTLGKVNNMFSMPTFINYKGKKYYMNEFNQQLRPFFENLEVTHVTIGNSTNSFKDCKKFEMNSFYPGRKASLFCAPIDQNKIEFEITGIQVTTMSGVRELQRKIDELEKLETQKSQEAKKAEETNKESSDDYWTKSDANKSSQTNSNKPQNSTTNTQSQSNWFEESQNLTKESNSTANQLNTQAEKERQEREKKMRELNTQMANFEQQRQSLNSASDATLSQWSQGNYIEGSKALVSEFARQGNLDAAVGTAVLGTGLQILSVLGQDKREREERERIEQQQRLAEEEALQRKKELEAQEERRKLLLETTRLKVISMFETKPYPSSISNIATNKIYYFTFSPVDDLKADRTSVTVSNVFAVGKYVDDTWPMQKNIITDLSKLKPNTTFTFCGYFTDYETAQATQSDFIQNMNKLNIETVNIQYKGKNSEVETSNNSISKEAEIDFWGNPVKNKTDAQETKNTEPEATKNGQKLDFWGNPIKG